MELGVMKEKVLDILGFGSNFLELSWRTVQSCMCLVAGELRSV